MATTKKQVVPKVRLTLTLDPELHKIIVEESAKMFMLPTKWLEFLVVTHNNQKTSLTNPKSKLKVQKREWPRLPLPAYIPTPSAHSAVWDYIGNPTPAMNADGHSYMDKDMDA